MWRAGGTPSSEERSLELGVLSRCSAGLLAWISPCKGARPGWVFPEPPFASVQPGVHHTLPSRSGGQLRKGGGWRGSLPVPQKASNVFLVVSFDQPPTHPFNAGVFLKRVPIYSSKSVFFLSLSLPGFSQEPSAEHDPPFGRCEDAVFPLWDPSPLWKDEFLTKLRPPPSFFLFSSSPPLPPPSASRSFLCKEERQAHLLFAAGCSAAT